MNVWRSVQVSAGREGRGEGGGAPDSARNSGTEPGRSPHWGLFTAEIAEGAEMNGVNELTNEIIGAAIEVHRTLGPRFTHQLQRQAARNGHPAPRP